MRRVVGAVITALLVLPGLFTGYLGIYYASASTTGPTTTLGEAERAWYRTQSIRFLALAGIFLGLAALWMIGDRRWRRSRSAV